MALNLRKTALFLKNNVPVSIPLRCFASPATLEKRKNRKNPPKVVRIDSVGTSLAAKGFLRSNKPYTAPQNAADKIKAICESLKVPTSPDTMLSNMDEKFKLLNACFKDFNYSVPNSQIHEMSTVGDVIAFYQTSVDTTVPLDAMKNMELPPNLHIQYDYIRFNPETDTKFNGKTAFPKSSTLVTGLKYRGKYEGHEAKRSWP